MSILMMWLNGMLMKLGGYLAAIGLAVLAVWGAYAYVKSVGRAEALEEIRKTNSKSEKEARDAAEVVRRECARDADKCLLDDPWTRDGGS